MLTLIFVTLFCCVLSKDLHWESHRDNLYSNFQEVLDAEVAWHKFKLEHNKVYVGIEEESLRKTIFATNYKFIKDHNALHATGEKSFTVGVNEFADMTVHEFAQMMNGLKPDSTRVSGSTYLSPNIDAPLPVEVDWRTKGLVSEVKNQGSCGSCWAFSTTGSLEGQHMRKTGTMVDLSEQNLVDCSTSYGNDGCNGGLMTNAFKYIKDNKGIDTEEAYPYAGRDGDCKFKKNKVGATVTGFVEIPAGNEKKLQEALATVGPVSVAIDANHQSFMLYKSGVYDEPECDSAQLDHGVLAVGYGSIHGKDYYIVKNSWGTTWGEQGYIRFSTTAVPDAIGGICGILLDASYPVIA
uniref:Cathepsin L n=1 Tax=Theromyzon tessulatum TaxID=13286 RepID=Q8IT42_THETS|nr:cathepsin L [Theromyzon tessulatum]